MKLHNHNRTILEKLVMSIKRNWKDLLINYIEDFKVIFTTTKVSNYFSNKDKTPHELKSNVVYEYKCSYDESIQYIGFTSRPLVERVKEHLKGKTAVSDHISNCNIWKKKVIIETEKSFY